MIYQLGGASLHQDLIKANDVTMGHRDQSKSHMQNLFMCLVTMSCVHIFRLLTGKGIADVGMAKHLAAC